MGLFEILLILVVTLLVVGPERMPETVRSVVLTIGRMKRFFNNARQEIEKQVGTDEIRQQLHNEAVMEQLAKVEEFSTQEAVLDQITSSRPHVNDGSSSEVELRFAETHVEKKTVNAPTQSSDNESSIEQEENTIVNDQSTPSSLARNK